MLVHYLNVPYPDDNKLAVITPNLALWADKKEWTKDELVSQLKPMFFSEDEPDLNNELEISSFKIQTAETVEAIVAQLMEKQRIARQAALVKQLECGCPDSTCADGKTCSHPMRRLSAAKESGSPLPSSSTNARPQNGADNNNQVSSTTGSGSLLHNNGHSPRVYTRENIRNHHPTSSTHNATANSGNTPPLVLSLSQIQGGGGLLILNSNAQSTNNTHKSLVTPVSVAGFVCSNGRVAKNENHKTTPLVLKQEAMDTSSCMQNGKTNQREDNSRQSLFDNLVYNRQEVIMTSTPGTPSKQMDTSHDDDFKHQHFSETVVLLDSRGAIVNKHESSSMVASGFFNETLDLSQEDIQRTLSANMPLCSSELERQHSQNEPQNTTPNPTQKQSNHNHHLSSEINPMDFIDNCDVVVSPTHVVDDDVFVNLDAFDMLGEFPDLEVLDSHHGLLESQDNKSKLAEGQNGGAQMEGTAKITDYSPEWAYPEGGVKVLVTGPWHSSGPYTVLFDTFPVPTTLVQSGVLRCYCPGL